MCNKRKANKIDTHTHQRSECTNGVPCVWCDVNSFSSLWLFCFCFRFCFSFSAYSRLCVDSFFLCKCCTFFCFAAQILETHSCAFVAAICSLKRIYLKEKYEKCKNMGTSCHGEMLCLQYQQYGSSYSLTTCLFNLIFFSFAFFFA